MMAAAITYDDFMVLPFQGYRRKSRMMRSSGAATLGADKAFKSVSALKKQRGTKRL